jgi:hypothetical protein
MLEAVRRIASDPSMGDDRPDEPPRDPSKLSVVGEMEEGELYSERLVAAAFRSPVVSTRNEALKVLSGRSREHWGEAVEAAGGH